jgi:hypothetical protein
MLRGDTSSYTDKRSTSNKVMKAEACRTMKRSAAPGHREQGNARRQEERIRPRQGGRSRAVAKGRTAWRPSRGAEACGRALTFGEEGSQNPQAPRSIGVTRAGFDPPVLMAAVNSCGRAVSSLRHPERERAWPGGPSPPFQAVQRRCREHLPGKPAC